MELKQGNKYLYTNTIRVGRTCKRTTKKQTVVYIGTEGNKQCVVNSLINNTVDLVSKGEKSQTITLSSPTKALLTSDEIAQITSKGYTIA